MHIARQCPACQSQLPSDAPSGLCPRCLVKLAVVAAPQPTGGVRTSSFVSSGRGGFVPPPVEALAAHFPQLELLELLGRGGMGAVYKARQPGLDRLVALKILPPDAADPTFERRFAQEARALARLNHPHIVTVYDSGVVDGLYYFVMEYINGVNLRAAIREQRLQSREALGIVGQVCDALQYAHDQGVVHRDIKPENILLDQRGQVKIADFGLAKLLTHDDADTALTGTHQVMGTPKYMAPEQLEGTKQVDHRADIYSLGVVFYELLTGELPLGRFAPPSKHAVIDTRLDDVVLRTLEKEPAERYQYASEVKTDVDAIAALPAPMPTRDSKADAALPTGSISVALQIRPRDGRDYGPRLAATLPIMLLYVVLPMAMVLGILITNGGHVERAFPTALLCALAFAGCTWAFFFATSLQSISFDAQGILLARYFGPSKKLAWDEIESLSLLTRGQVMRRVWLWPGLWPRGSLVGMASWPYFGITTARGSWYVCPGEIERFLGALARYAPPELAIPATGEADLDEPILAQRRQQARLGAANFPSSSRPETTASHRPRLVPALAIVNLLLATLFLLSSFIDDPFATYENSELYRAYSFAVSAASYVTSAMLLTGSIGLLMWKSWGRWLTMAVWGYVVGAFVLETPIVVSYTLPAAFQEMKSDLVFDGMDEATAALAAGLLLLVGFGVITALALGWSIGQLVYFTRPRVKAAFEPLSPAWAAVQAPLIAWTSVFVMICFGLLALFLSPLGPRIETRSTLTVAPRHSSYDSLWMTVDFIDMPVFDKTPPTSWQAIFNFQPPPSDDILKSRSWQLTVQLPSLEARWQRENQLIGQDLGRLTASKLQEVIARDLSVKVTAAERDEINALLQLLQSWSQQRPASATAMRDSAQTHLNTAFSIGELRQDDRQMHGFSIEQLALLLATSTIAFAAGCAAWGFVGGRIASGELKPLQFAQRELQCFGGTLVSAGLLTLVGSVVMMPLLVMYADSHHHRYFEVIIPIIGGWSLFGSVGLIFAGLRTRTLTGLTAPWIGSIVCLVPLSPLALLTIPIGVWGLWLLSRPAAGQAVQHTSPHESLAAPASRRAEREESLAFQLGSLVGLVLHSRSAPTVGAMLLGVLAAVSATLDWVRVTDTLQVPAELGSDQMHSEHFSGWHHFTGTSFAATGLALCLVLFATGPVRRSTLWRGAVVVSAAALMTAQLMLYWKYASFFEIASHATEIAQDLGLPGKHVVEPTALTGMWYAGGCVLGLWVLAAWELRRAQAAQQSGPSRPLDGPHAK